MRDPGFETLCAHAGEDPRRFLGAATPPLFQNSLFTAEDSQAFLERSSRHPEVYDYTRVANPTTDILEAKLAALEGTDAARCFGSGMAAVAAVLLHAVRTGDEVVAVETVYGPTRAFLSGYLTRFDVSTRYVSGLDPEEVEAALTPRTRLIYLESPSSLVFHLQDLEAICRIAREREVVTVIDNSWASPYFQNPARFGVDLVLHSATKYLGGHSDLVAGVVMGSRERMERIKAEEGALLGGILDPFAAWLMLRGVRTLPVRMDRHMANGLAVARWLEAHPRVACVHYPGLDSHPQRELVRKQLRGSSGLMSFELKDGGRAAAMRFVDRLRYFGIGVSWGGFESLAIPLSFPKGSATRRTPNLRWGARLHVGLETVDDLIDDLEQALAG